MLSATIENEWEKLREVKCDRFRIPRGRPGFDSPTGRDKVFIDRHMTKEIPQKENRLLICSVAK